MINIKLAFKFIYIPSSKKYFLDRHHPTFAAVWDYYYTGILRRPDEIPLDVMFRELQFYCLEEHAVEDFLKSECILKRGLSCYSTRIALKTLSEEILSQHDAKKNIRRNIVHKIGFCIVSASIASFCLETGKGYVINDKSSLSIIVIS